MNEQLTNDQKRAQPLVIGNWSLIGHWGLLIATFAAMVVWSWGTWPDPIVDFGREVYVPWQLSQGKVLYRDIVSYFNGPFSPYLHALLFKIFGVSLRTLVIFNLGVIGALVVMLRCLIAQWAGQSAATVCAIVLLVLFAFAQFVPGGNYNYVTPYSYELPHGLTLTVAGIACLTRWQKKERTYVLAAAGVFLGLVFLTKVEVFLAALAAMGAGLAGMLWIKRYPPRRAGLAIGIFLLAVLATVTIAFLLLLSGLSPNVALHGLAGSWPWLRQSNLINLAPLQKGVGTDDLGASIQIILEWTGVYLALFLPTFIAAVYLKRSNRSARLLTITIALVYCIAGAIFWRDVAWPNFVRPLPLILSVALLVALLQVVIRKNENLLPLMLLAWATAMLAKMFFNARIFNYGFALGMPATLVCIALLAGVLPLWIDRRGGSGTVLRAAVLSALVVAVGAHLYGLNHFWQEKRVVVGTGDDTFIADSRGKIVNAVMKQLEEQTPPGSTLVSIPEGLIFNYLARRENPTGQLNFTPPAIVMYGEDAMLSAFQSHPPNYILVMRLDESDYGGTGFFGEDYGKLLGAWIEQNYQTLTDIPVAPGEAHEYDTRLLKRK